MKFLLFSILIWITVQKRKTLLVVEAFRHGARTPYDMSKNMGIDWDIGEGALTPLGER